MTRSGLPFAAPFKIEPLSSRYVGQNRVNGRNSSALSGALVAVATRPLRDISGPPYRGTGVTGAHA
jgi:hypothetical protein